VKIEPIAERPHMPDYGVDADGWSPLPWSWAGTKLDSGRNYWIVTASATARPHAMPTWGVWSDEEKRFAFSCGPRSRKARNLGANPQATIAVDETAECLSLEGRAEQVSDESTMGAWIDRYLAKYQPMAPGLSADFLRQNLIFEFTPERAFGIIEREEEFATRATRWRF
jgi:hypothetical protein